MKIALRRRRVDPRTSRLQLLQPGLRILERLRISYDEPPLKTRGYQRKGLIRRRCERLELVRWSLAVMTNSKEVFQNVGRD